MSSDFKPRCTPLAIGSFPYKDTDLALDAIFRYFSEIPLWPQLPAVDEQEQMYIQYYEGMPGIEFDSEKHKLTAGEVDDGFFEKMAEMLEHVMSEDLEYFAISEDKARGFRRFLEKSGDVKSLNPRWVKGHITGPVSFGLVITDKDMKPALYDESYREVIREVLKMKALWQVEKLKEIHPHVIILMDEPYMASFGSSMVALSQDEAVFLMGDIIRAIEEKGAVSGIHCCGNTDWSVIIKTGCRIISFDAYEYGDKFLLYRDELVNYLESGGMIAWGIIPTSEDVNNEDAASLVLKLENLVNRLAGEGIDRETVLKQSFISPSCGLGSIPVERGERIMKMVTAVQEVLKDKYPFLK
jgi:hypothetical protein